MKKGTQTIAALAAALLASSCHHDEAEKPADTGPARVATPSSNQLQATGMVAETLKGKLVKVKGGAATDYELTGNPEYYVIYHSASW